MYDLEEPGVVRPPIELPQALLASFGISELEDPRGLVSSIHMRTADSIALMFACPGGADAAVDYGPLARLNVRYRHDASRGYVADRVATWGLFGDLNHEGPPESVTVETLRDLGYRHPDHDDDDRKHDALMAGVVGLIEARTADGKALLDAERPRFLEIERDMRADEADRLRRGVDAVESRRQELERELDR